VNKLTREYWVKRAFHGVVNKVVDSGGVEEKEKDKEKEKEKVKPFHIDNNQEKYWGKGWRRRRRR
jgi:hypothetical protein